MKVKCSNCGKEFNQNDFAAQSASILGLPLVCGDCLANSISEQRKRNHKVIDLVLENQLQKTTIKRLVELVDRLRQPYNNSRYHDLYLEATNTLNDLEEREQI